MKGDNELENFLPLRLAHFWVEEKDRVKFNAHLWEHKLLQREEEKADSVNDFHLRTEVVTPRQLLKTKLKIFA